MATFPFTTPRLHPIRWNWLVVALLLFLLVLALPAPAGLPLAGQRALAILAFAMTIWVTEAVSLPVSSVLILGLISLVLGLSPDPNHPAGAWGSRNALALALSGFSTPAVALVTGALVLAAAMEITGLSRRIALQILVRVGPRSRDILLGAILAGVALAFLVPSVTARVSAMIPISLGMVSAFGLGRNSRLATLLMVVSAQTATIWNVGIKTAAAQNMVGLSLLETAFGRSVAWGEWFLYAAPWAALMTAILYVVALKALPPDLDTIPMGQETIARALAQMGPLSRAERRLLAVSIALLLLWATERVLHPLDSTTVTLVATALILTPGVGIITWQQVEGRVPWGILILLGAGISLGTVLLQTQAASWLAGVFFQATGIGNLPVTGMLAILAAFLILLHLGFASATSLSATLLPVIISLLQGLHRPEVSGPGLVLILQFVINFGFMLPVNDPQNMIAYGTGTFTTRDFIRCGLPLTVAGYLLVLLFSATYWRWLGLV